MLKTIYSKHDNCKEINVTSLHAEMDYENITVFIAVIMTINDGFGLCHVQKKKETN
jgi:hypothetical protein